MVQECVEKCIEQVWDQQKAAPSVFGVEMDHKKNSMVTLYDVKSFKHLRQLLYIDMDREKSM